MNLDSNVINYIQKVVRCAQLVNIDSIIIEANAVRALSEDKTVFIFQETDVPTLPFTSIGLNRLDVFGSRLDVAKTSENFSVDALIDDSETFVRALVMKGKGLKIDYRCASPKTIVAIKRFNDVLKTKVEITPEAVVLMQKGQAAMRAEVVTLISDKNGVSFELTDINSDVFSHTFTTKATPLTQDQNTQFVYRYPVKLLLTLLKNNPSGQFCVGQKGILNVVVNDLNLFALPQV